MKYCILAVSKVETEEKHDRDHHIYHQCERCTYRIHALMLLLSLSQSCMQKRGGVTIQFVNEDQNSLLEHEGGKLWPPNF